MRYTTLLLFCFVLASPVHSQQLPDVEKFVAGESKTYNTTGHPKAQGLRIVLRYPESWAAEAGNHPHVVQKFVSEGGSGLELATLTIMPAPDTPPMPTAPDIFRNPSKILPKGSQVVDSSRTKIDGIDAAWVQYVHRQNNANADILLVGETYNLVFDGHLITVMLGAGGPVEKYKNILSRYRNHTRLFQLMANSIVVENQWQQ